MKQIYIPFLALLLMVFTIGLSAQDFNMPTTGTLEITDCAGTIYDSGGPNGDYGNNEDGVIIIDPPGDDLVSITIISFSLENSGTGCWDEMFIYDGSGTGAPLFPDTPAAGWCWDLTDTGGTAGSGDLNGMTFISSGDALTLQFTSDGTQFRSGFEIIFGCLSVEDAPIPNLGASPASSCDGVIEFSNTGAIADIWELDYNWDFGDGNTSTDPNPTNTYAVEGTYDVSLELCNQFGCTDTTFVEAVAFNPDDASCFEITMPVFSTLTYTGCSVTLFDSGGPDAPGVLNNAAEYTIIADEPNSIMVVDFVDFVGGDFSNDFMTVFDGPDINSPVLAFYDINAGNIPTGQLVTSGDAVTIQFQQNFGFNLGANYEILVNCLNTEVAPEPVVGVENTLTCSGAASFFNAGIEAGTWDLDYTWDFGDGNTSTDANPTHTYTTEGTYDVTLELCNQFGCGETTLVQAITFDSQDASCFEFIMPGFDTQVIASCTGTLFDSGGPGAFAIPNNDAVTTIAPGGENVISLDFVELTLNQFGDLLTIYDGSDLTAPVIAVFNGTNFPNSPIVSSGNAVTIQSQAFGFNANYEILVSCIPVDGPPSAAIQTSPPFFTCNAAVQFTDISGNAATSWTWDFGDGNTSTEENPFHVYSAPGTFEVTLTACNNFGCEETTVNYGVLLGDDPACEGVSMSVNAEEDISECSGTLYDSGGADGPFTVGEQSVVVLGSPGSLGVTVVFTEFDLGNFNNDVVNIYDGPDTGSPLIGSYSGSFLPEFGGMIQSENSFMTIEFAGDPFTFGPGPGFTAAWNVQGGTEPPVAAFEAEGLTPAFGVPFQFTDLTTELPSSWFWDFGDGNNGFTQNPAHVYTTPGENVVTLNASNCVGSDDAESITVTVQGPPLILTDADDNNPEGWVVNLNAEETLDTTFNISNFGGGDLYYEITGFEYTFAGLVQILAYDFGTNDMPSNADVIPSIEEIISDNLTGVTFNTTSTTSITELEELLQNTNIFLVAGQSGNDLDPDIMTEFGPTLQNFVDDGGTVLFMASQRPEIMFNTGLMEGDFTLDFNNDTTYNRNDFYNPNLEHGGGHPILEGVAPEFEGKSGCIGVELLGDDIQQLMKESSFDLISYREQGEGKVVYLGFNYFLHNEPMDEILINTILWSGTQENAVQWLFADPTEGIIEPGFGEDVTLTFNAIGAPGGTYTANLVIESNDPDKEEIVVPVTINIVGTPAFGINTTDLDYENIIQFTNETQTVTITNTGTDSLFITDIIFPSGDYEASISDFGLYPTLTQNVDITFSPSDVELIEDAVIIIQTNVGDYEVLVNANVTGAPISTVNPTPVEITVDYGGTGSADLTLTNPGLGFLEYDIENPLSSLNGFAIEFSTAAFTNGFSWQLLDSNNNVVISEGPYTEGPATFTEEFTALNPCEQYTMVLNETGFGSITEWSISNLLTGDVIDSGFGLAFNEVITVELGEVNPNWVSYNEAAGELPWPDGEQVVSLDFDPGCLLGGVYESTVLVNSNDPVNPVLEVPVIMTVVGVPDITFLNSTPGESLDFGSILIGLTSTNEITITNNGTDNLVIDEDGFVFDNEQFSVSPSDVSLAPGEELTLVVTFTPDEITDNSANLTIISNAGEFDFVLNGAGQGAPATTVAPGEIEITLLAGESASEEVNIFNAGEGNLEYLVGLEGGETGFTFVFETDNFPSELIWELTDSEGNVVGGMPQGTYDQANTFYTETVSGLNSFESYTLLIQDSFTGCDGAVSSYSISDFVTGELIEEGGQVGQGDCQFFTNIGTPTASDELVFSPDNGLVGFPSDDVLSVDFDATGYEAGVYDFTVILLTNDPDNPTIDIPVTINVIAFPQAEFTANNDPVVCGTEPISFEDVSINVPTNWFWDFGDGVGTSTEQNPTYQYAGSGTYDVSLIASNNVGADTILIESFIVVDINCQVGNVGTNPLLEACNGQLYDTGGENDNYNLNSTGVTTIAPPGATSVTIAFTVFEYENGIDFVNIYDGPDTDSPLLGEFTGNDLQGLSISSTGGSITIEEVADPFFSTTGFEAFFSCEEIQAPPTANYTFATNSSCGGVYDFSDASVPSANSWEWDFGDGGTATVPNPSHQYTETGTYTVTMIATNDLGSDTYEETIDVFVLNVESTIPDETVSGQEVNFSIDNIEAAWSVTWDFGDGSALSNATNPSHTYTTAGEENEVYTVTAQISDPNVGLDCIVTLQQEITVFGVEPPPSTSVTFQVDPQLIEISGEGMFLIGSFNNFEPIAMEMVNDSLYSVTVDLDQGASYTYLFGNGSNSETLDAGDECAVDDGTGTYVRTVEVGTENEIVIDPICYGLCQDCILIGIQDIPNAQLTIAPNPSNGLLNYQLNMEQVSDLQLVITNSIGQVIYRDYLTNQANYEQQIDLTNYSNGLYMVRFTNDTQQLVKPFILQR